MKKILIILIGFMFIGFASSLTINECYQETANTTSACGGLANGSYASTGGAGWNNQDNLYDGNWGTSGVSSTPATGSTLKITYRKMLNATGAKIQYRTDSGYGNATISSSCWNYNSTHIHIFLRSGVGSGSLTCQNSSSGGTIGDITLATTGATHYEEAAIWQQAIMDSNDYALAECNNTYLYPYINFEYRDELTNALLNATATNTQISHTGYQTFSLTNTSNFTNINFCSPTANNSITPTFYMPYSSTTTYPQRIYQAQVPLNGSLVSKTLYLLSSTYGSYVTFQLINAAEQPLEDVFVVINKSISGTQRQISAGYTGADGGITFWLNPDDQYTISAYLDPYPSYSTTQAFTQDSYTITLGSNSEINASDYTKGITYSIVPTSDWLSNGTTYSFNFTLSSSYWALDSWGFNITNGSYTWLGNITNTTSTGGISKLSLNTGSNSTLILTYFWTVGNDTTQAVRIYRVLDYSQNQYSLTRLVSDFASYKASGFFGLTDWATGLIVFFIIVGSVGAAKVKFGISDEATLAGLFVGLVALADFGFGVIPNPVSAIPHLPTVVVFILFIGFAMKEMRT